MKTLNIGFGKTALIIIIGIIAISAYVYFSYFKPSPYRISSTAQASAVADYIASTNGTASQCEKIQVADLGPHPLKSEYITGCYKALAVRKNDINICNFITDDRNADLCRSKIKTVNSYMSDCPKLGVNKDSAACSGYSKIHFYGFAKDLCNYSLWSDKEQMECYAYASTKVGYSDPADACDGLSESLIPKCLELIQKVEKVCDSLSEEINCKL